MLVANHQVKTQEQLCHLQCSKRQLIIWHFSAAISQHQCLTNALPILLNRRLQSNVKKCYSFSSQLLAKINVLPMACQSCSTAGDKVLSQSGTQSSPNDGPISMFYQCPPNPTTLHLAELCQMLLLNYNLLSMNSQYQLIVNGATTEKQWMTCELIEQLLAVPWGNTGCSETVG